MIFVFAAFMVGFSAQRVVSGANYNTDYITGVDVTRSEYLTGGAHLTVERTQSKINGTGQLSNNTFYYIDFPDGYAGYEMVVWSKGAPGNGGFRAYTTPEMAKDYEDKHPGYTVVAAINGDFFDINGDGAPTYTHVQNGEVYRTNGQYALGFNTPGDIIYAPLGKTSKPVVHVLDANGNSTSKTQVAVHNGALSASGISVYIEYGTDITTTNEYVYVVEIDTLRNKDASSLYAKGTVKEVINSGTTLTKVAGRFYIVSPTQLSLSAGSKVKVQYDITGALESRKNIIGVNTQFLTNGVSGFYNSSDDMARTTHPRTFVGIKPDGTPVLAVVPGRGFDNLYNTGVSFFTQAEMLKAVGCTQGFNLDGGGSTTMLVRNSKGELEPINFLSDGGLRSDGNCILLVTRDPKITVSNIGDKSFTLTAGQFPNGTVEKFSVTVNGKNYEFAPNESVEITGLTRNNTYKTVITYDIINSDSTITHAQDIKNISTLGKEMPKFVSASLTNVTDTSFTVKYNFTDRGLTLTSSYVLYKGTKYPIERRDPSIDISGVVVENGDLVQIVLESVYGIDTVQDLTVKLKETNTPSSGCNMGAVLAGLLSLALIGALVISRKETK